MTQIDPWQLDKRIPIAFIIAIISQLIVGVWVASAFWSRVDVLEGAIETMAQNSLDREARIRALELGASRTEERLITIQTGLSRIERLLEQRYEP